MALPAYNNAVLCTIKEGTVQTAALVCTVPSLSHWGESSDSTTIGTFLLREQPQQLPYYKNAMDWGKSEEDTSGSFIGTTEFHPHIDNDADNDPESSDRMKLLAKKYASEEVKLPKEDDARLEMINQKMDLKYPRYSAKDWELLDEAKTLVNELSNTSGQKAE